MLKVALALEMNSTEIKRAAGYDMWKGHYEQIYEGIKVASVQGRRRSCQGDWCIQTMKEGCTWRSVILSV